jgi:8-oxo-dGTP diphosphatase
LTPGEGAVAGEVVLAAGAVLWRGGPAGPEIALVHRPRYDDWSFPKGKLDDGEHVLRGVVREVVEETGVTPRLGRRLPTQFYLVGDRPKRVDYWVATPAAGPDGPTGFVPDDEVDRMEWLPITEAGRRLTYERDVDLLHEAAAGPLLTTPLIILRHSPAGAKSEWRDLDVLRPLDDRGRIQARELAGLLAPFCATGHRGSVRLMSSATARCVETLLPYALLERTSVTTECAFTVAENDGPQRAVARIFEVVTAGEQAIVCTHGEIVPVLLGGLCARFGLRTPDEPALPKGGFWVLHLATSGVSAVTGIVGLDRHLPTPHGTGPSLP